MTAAVDVRLERLEKVLLLPLEAVAMRQGQAVVEVLRDGRSEIVPVTTGPANDCEVVIQAGLPEGAIVARNPKIAPNAEERPPK